MERLHHALRGFTKLYFPILFASLFVGVNFSEQTIHLAPYSTHLLALIFFLAALKIDLKQLISYLKDRKMMFEVNIFMLIALPTVVYFITNWIYPELTIALVLLATMPSGMTDALLSEIAGGNKNLALVFTVSTSLLAPFTIPLMLKLLLGAAVVVPFMDMAILLGKVIFVPFIIANLLKMMFRKQIDEAYDWFTPVSIILLALLTIGIVAKQSDIIRSALVGGKPMIYLALLFTFFIGIHLISYLMVFWRNHTDRIAITICSTYMNVTLAIYLADKFFTGTNVVAPVILAILPWSLLLVPFKAIVGHIKEQEA